MATNTKNVAIRGLGDVFTPDRYSGEDLYNKSQTTDKNTRVKNYLKEGLADILTFAGGALTNLYSPMGLAAGLGAVAQRHGAMNEARQDYVNKLNNNLMLYDQATSQGFRPSITRDQVTGNTDLSLIMPKDGNKYWDMQTNQDTISHQNDIYGAGAGQTQETYNNELGSNQINTSPITTNLPTMQELTLDTTPKTNALPESPVINTLANNGEYGNFDVNFNQTPLLQGNIQQQSAPYLVNPDLYKTFYKTGVENVEGAKGLTKDYHNIDTTAQTSRENNIRSTNASIANNIRSTGVSRQNFLDNLAYQMSKEQGLGGNLSPKELAKQQELEEIQQQLNNFQAMFDKVPNKLRGATTGAARRLVGLASNNEANFDAQRTLLFNQIARKLGGEKGVLSDGDIKRIEKALPTLSDSFEQRNAKMKAVYDLLDIKKGNTVQKNDPLGIR